MNDEGRKNFLEGITGIKDENTVNTTLKYLFPKKRTINSSDANGLNDRYPGDARGALLSIRHAWNLNEYIGGEELSAITLLGFSEISPEDISPPTKIDSVEMIKYFLEQIDGISTIQNIGIKKGVIAYTISVCESLHSFDARRALEELFARTPLIAEINDIDDSQFFIRNMYWGRISREIQNILQRIFGDDYVKGVSEGMPSNMSDISLYCDAIRALLGDKRIDGFKSTISWEEQKSEDIRSTCQQRIYQLIESGEIWEQTNMESVVWFWWGNSSGHEVRKFLSLSMKDSIQGEYRTRKIANLLIGQVQSTAGNYESINFGSAILLVDFVEFIERVKLIQDPEFLRRVRESSLSGLQNMRATNFTRPESNDEWNRIKKKIEEL